MVYMNFPARLTEEEEFLQKKFAKLRKKKKALQAQRAPKPEPAQETTKPIKRSSEEAANATEKAKKLLKSGAIKLSAARKERSFKRTKRQKETDKTSVSFQPFSPTHQSDPEDEAVEPGKSKVKGLYDSFIKEAKQDREERRVDHDKDRDKERDRDRDRDRNRIRGERDRDRSRDPPQKGNTVYIFGHGITEEIVKKAFSNFGNVVNISMETDKHCAFVTFEKMESADEAITEMNGSMIETVQLKVSMARRQPTFEAQADTSNSSWSSIAASQSQKGSHKDVRDLVAYDDSDIF